MRRKVLLTLLVLILIPVLAGLGVVGHILYEVNLGNYEHMEKEAIQNILARESVVYYADGKKQLGSFFGEEHRIYVKLQDIPEHLQKAIIASEDDGFYQHMGVDLKSTARAAYRTIFMGKREGASTITQQTVKNLFGRRRDSNIFLIKYRELINALKLEKKYSKQEILEFYLNQFGVTSNGRGVGIASKYYFDKNVSELNLVESAFIVGSVKNPSKYNVFTKRTEESKKRSEANAKSRKNYVLRRMYETQKIDESTYSEAVKEPIPFKKGKFRFNRLTVIELIKRHLSKKSILEAVGVESVEQLSEMGLHITTTIQEDVQTSTEFALQRNLSRLDIILKGFSKAKKDDFFLDLHPKTKKFYVMQLENINAADAKKPSLEMKMGNFVCTVPSEELLRVASFLGKPKYQSKDKMLPKLLGTLAQGDYLHVSLLEIDENKQGRCGLEIKPKIRGAILVLDKGRIVSLAGGFKNNEFNRAIHAKRQPGSTFKPITFLAAMQLGWALTDSIPNTRNGFIWTGEDYFPNPDHRPADIETNLVGATAKSENLASIWILAHLLDKLSETQFFEVLSFLDIYTPGASGQSLSRIALDEFNVRNTEVELKRGILDLVKNEYMSDISIATDKHLKALVQNMHYGSGFEKKLRFYKGLRGDRMRKYKVTALLNNLLRWQTLSRQAIGRFQVVQQAILNGEVFPSERVLQALRYFRLREDNLLAYMGPDPINIQNLSKSLKPVKTIPVNPSELYQALLDDRINPELGAIYLDGLIPIDIIQELTEEVANRYASVSRLPAERQFYYNKNFRINVAMQYAKQFVKMAGIENKIVASPSFPLGTNDITLEELALVYQTILSGKMWKHSPESESLNETTVISKIEDSHGMLLWSAESESTQLFDEFFSTPLLSALRTTVTRGTGARSNNIVLGSADDPELDEQLKKRRIRVPVFGKTGTTNSYVNATYVGFLPYPAAPRTKVLTPNNAYTIAAYVGYDQNRSMKNGAQRISGASGALPMWIDTATAIVEEEKYIGNLAWEDPTIRSDRIVPFRYNGDYKVVNVPMHSTLQHGLSSQGGSGKNGRVTVAMPGRYTQSIFEPDIRFQPFFKDNIEEKVEVIQKINRKARQPAQAILPIGALNPDPKPAPTPKEKVLYESEIPPLEVQQGYDRKKDANNELPPLEPEEDFPEEETGDFPEDSAVEEEPMGMDESEGGLPELELE